MKTLNTQPGTAKRRAALRRWHSNRRRRPRHMTTTRQSRLGSLIAAGAITVGAMTALAPAATADKPQTEGQIKAECGQANGNYYSSGVMPDGHTYSACCYSDYKGKRWCDSYQDGGYTTTLPAIGKKLPPLGPGAGSTPPIAPPITNGPPAANAN